MSRDTVIKLIKYGLLALIILTLAFIYAQSFKSPEQSTADSDKVGDIIAEVIPPETKPGEFIQTNIRKLAHFTEFSVLGFEIGVFLLFFYRRLYTLLLAYPLGIILAVFDETVQIFTERGPQISDVWIDFAGFSLSMALTTAVFYLVKFANSQLRKRKT